MWIDIIKFMVINSFKENIKIKFYIIVLFFCQANCVLYSETVFMVDFEKGLNASFSTGDTKAYHAKTIQAGDAISAEGKFGKGVKIGKDIPAYALNYKLPKNFSWKEGTIEFWFKPDWDCRTLQHNDDPNLQLRGRPIVTTLFSSGNSPNGVYLMKDQYNNLTFAFTNRYNREAYVNARIKQNSYFCIGKWVYLACSWDDNEGRIFANGKLLAVSDKWKPEYLPGRRVALGCGKYGKGRGAGGVFDELRISNDKRYISSFPVPKKAFAIPKKTLIKSKSIKEKPKIADKTVQNPKVLFDIDFNHGLKPQITNGGTRVRANNTLQFKSIDGEKYLRLNRPEKMCGDTLCYEVSENLNPFLGRIDMEVRLYEKTALPAILFDCLYLRSRGATGMRFLINAAGKLEWRCLEDGHIVVRVKSTNKITLNGKSISLGVSWGNGKVKLFSDKKKVGKGIEIPMPSRLGRYFYIGSNCEGKNTFNGLIKSLTINLTK